MKTAALCLAALCISGVALGGSLVDDEIIVARGDANNDGGVDVSDVTYISTYLQGGDAPPCANQADADDDGDIDASDAAYLANYLFNGGPQPPHPGPANTECTTDAKPRPGCESPPGC